MKARRFPPSDDSDQDKEEAPRRPRDKMRQRPADKMFRRPSDKSNEKGT